MSHIGKKPIQIPEGIEVRIENDEVLAKGPKGELRVSILPGLKIDIKDRKILIRPTSKSKRIKASWGLFRSLVFNLVEGVREGFEKKLTIHGVGYKAFLEGKDLVLHLGFSHPINYPAPSGVEFTIEKNTIIISGINKQQVGQIAAEIRAKRKPEPYKGKGIRYHDEAVRRKAGKKTIAKGT